MKVLVLYMTTQWNTTQLQNHSIHCYTNRTIVCHLSEVSYGQRDKYGMISHVWALKTKWPMVTNHENWPRELSLPKDGSAGEWGEETLRYWWRDTDILMMGLDWEPYVPESLLLTILQSTVPE